jgi:hypothetical protein
MPRNLASGGAGAKARLRQTIPPSQVCECVVILRNLKDVSWAGAKSMMADPYFLKSLMEFDKDGLSDKQVGPGGRGTGGFGPGFWHC